MIAIVRRNQQRDHSGAVARRHARRVARAAALRLAHRLRRSSGSGPRGALAGSSFAADRPTLPVSDGCGRPTRLPACSRTGRAAGPHAETAASLWMQRHSDWSRELRVRWEKDLACGTRRYSFCLGAVAPLHQATALVTTGIQLHDPSIPCVQALPEPSTLRVQPAGSRTPRRLEINGARMPTPAVRLEPILTSSFSSVSTVFLSFSFSSQSALSRSIGTSTSMAF